MQPWDQKGFRVPGGVGFQSAAVTQAFTGATTMVAKKTLHNYPAPAAILSCVYEGTLVPIERGLEIEAKYFATLVTSPVSRNLIRTTFVNKGAADKLAARPAGIEKTQVRRLGVLGAGMMGAGIAHVSALAGIEVVLIDASREFAERGRAHAAKLLAKEVEKGRRTQAQADAVLARITPTVDYAALDETVGDLETVDAVLPGLDGLAHLLDVLGPPRAPASRARRIRAIGAGDRAAGRFAPFKAVHGHPCFSCRQSQLTSATGRINFSGNGWLGNRKKC